MLILLGAIVALHIIGIILLLVATIDNVSKTVITFRCLFMAGVLALHTCGAHHSSARTNDAMYTAT